MKDCRKYNLVQVTGLILLAGIGAGILGCSPAGMYQDNSASRAPLAAHRVELTFSSPLAVTIPEQEPVTVRDHIKTGLFYFRKERYAGAARAFQQANAGIANKDCELARQCLVASSICYLIINDRKNFQNTMEQLKTAYNKYELMDISSIDKRVDVLLRLSRELNRNY